MILHLIHLTLALFSAQSAFAAHGDNMGCIGCSVTMEHAFQHIADHATTLGNRMSLTEQKTTQVDLSSLLKKLREEVPEYEQYSPQVGSTASEMITKWVNIVATSFAGDEPTETNMYNRTHQVCVKTLDYCDEHPPPSSKLLSNQCEMCKAVVADIVMVVRRHEGGFPLYRTKSHVYNVLDTACSSSVLRIPPSIHTKFSSMCEEIVEESEHELAEALMSNLEGALKRVCADVTGMCSNKDRNYMYVWTSSFHQVPYEKTLFFPPHRITYKKSGNEGEENKNSSSNSADDGVVSTSTKRTGKNTKGGRDKISDL
jgi:hypothetical protein